MKTQDRKARARPKRRAPPKISHTHKPADLAPVDWQRALRRQFGREQAFHWKNIGDEAIFSDFQVSNPASRSRYRVTIRGLQPGDNRCSCPDFATNELGTCKHIEFVLAKLLKKRGAKAAFARGYQPVFSELVLHNDGRRSVRFRPGSACPAALRKAAARLFAQPRGDLHPDRVDDLESFMNAAAKAGHELRVPGEVLDFVAGWRDAAHRARTLDRLFPRGAADWGRARLTKLALYPYQVEGALFAARAGRALIGDEMGLGKTAQAIAAAEILARHFGVSRVLVVCPTSLKYQWQGEFLRFAGRKARVIAGGRAQRQKDYARDDFCKITNYEKLDPDLDLITGWAPELVIVDEAQRIKNWNTIAARALKRIDSPYAVVLTGTPLENKLEELISIVQYVDQHRLGPTWRLLHEHQVRDEAGRVIGYAGLDTIGKTLAPIMIRRRKAEVLRQLPERTDSTILVPMTEAQMRYHEDNADIVARIVQRWRKTRFLSDTDQRRLTCALQNMRMACNSTYLLDQESDHGVKADEVAALVDDLAAQDAKAVIFSQWTRSHDIVIRRLKARGMGYVSFHGGVPSEKRPALVQRFRDDADCRVFLSTDAGSTGLNLQHATTLINMDLPWNPAILEQRIARIHRMGQKRPVRIVNLVAKGTIEEGMLGVLAFKRSLSAGILDGGAGEVSLGGSRLNRFMKDVENVTGRMGEAAEVAPAEEHAFESAVSNAGARSGGEGVAGDGGAVPALPGEGRDRSAPATAHAAQDPWVTLAGLGRQLLGAFAAAHDNGAVHPWVERDAPSGRSSLKIPLPPPEIARELAAALARFIEAFQGRDFS